MTQIESTWRYGQVKSNALNVRREPSRKARRWNNVWPMNRLVLVKPGGVDGWYETLYRGEPAYVMAEFIKLLDDPVPNSIVERMMFMALPDNGRSKSIYFNGYNGKWCHRFADWLAMNAYSVMLREYPDVMNIEQMSQALGVSTKTGYGLLKSGKVACLRVGRAYRIPKVHLLTYMKVMEQEKSGKTNG